MTLNIIPLKWQGKDGEPISCEEKIKVLNDNLSEISALYQDALEDAILMGCDEDFVKDVFHHMINVLDRPYLDA